MKIKQFLSEARTGTVWVLLSNPIGEIHIKTNEIMDSLHIFSSEASLVEHMKMAMSVEELELGEIESLSDKNKIKNIKTIEEIFKLINEADQLSDYRNFFIAESFPVETK